MRIVSSFQNGVKFCGCTFWGSFFAGSFFADLKEKETVKIKTVENKNSHGTFKSSCERRRARKAKCLRRSKLAFEERDRTTTKDSLHDA